MRVNSSGDMLGLIAELNSRRIAMITGKMAKRQGGQLQLPKKTLNLLQTARRLHHRYSAGDYRHDVAEQDKIRDLCQWLVQQHDILEGRVETAKMIPWDAPGLQSKEPPADGTYVQLMMAIHGGEIDDSLNTEE